MPIHDWSKVDAGIFHDFHLEWLAALKHSLNSGLLPENYYALTEQVIGGLEPDVLALDLREETSPPNGDSGNGSGGSPNGNGGDTITIPKVQFVSSTTSDVYSRKAKRVTIRHSSGDRIVAVIEVVSLGNKSSRNALRSFVEKVIDLLTARVNLLILDLHPPSTRDPNGIHGAIWSEIGTEDYVRPAESPLTLVAYHPVADETKAYIQPTAIGRALQEMPLFLGEELHVNVPLEATYLSAFEHVPARWRKVLESPDAQS